MVQRRHDLAVLHWRMPPAAQRPRVPPDVELDTFDGSAWLAVTPFRMSGVRVRWLPPVPTASAFPELNVRTYVRRAGMPGVFFFSLDAASTLAVLGARASFGLPYHRARMRLAREGEGDADGVRFTSRRARGSAELVARYAPRGPARQQDKGSLEHFLTERYCLFAWNGHELLRGDIHHRPWPLQPATAEFERQTMAAAASFTLPDEPPLLHYAGRLDVLIWAPVRSGGA
jgi:uncharacterized protein YqjF (DUF2071 family)